MNQGYSSDPMEAAQLIQDILRLKKQRNAVILVHNYQNPEIYEVADFLGDSLGLSKEAAKTDADVIVFCGVHFMAESAAILNPGKVVLLPREDAGCPMADMVTAPALRKMKAQYLGVPVVCYVNSSAEVKAESDICCTSSNAVEVAKSLKEKRIIMVPDRNLAAYVQQQLPEKEIISWNGWCYVHDQMRAADILKLKKKHPKAEVIVHPECRQEMFKHADCVTSTGGMLTYARKSKAKEFIIATECGMVNRLKRELAGKEFYAVGGICKNMKKTTLQAVKDSLEKMQYRITVPEEIAVRARVALERMIAIKAGRGAD